MAVERRRGRRRWVRIGLAAASVGLACGREDAAVVEPAAAARPVEVEPVPSPTVVVRIRANVEARVVEDGVTIGTTSGPQGFVRALPRSEVLRSWVVRAEGYRDQTVLVRPTMVDALTIEVELTRADAPGSTGPG